jgi:ketosteroid isomerase-like protein
VVLSIGSLCVARVRTYSRPVEEHPNVERIRRALAAYNAGDLDEMRLFIAEDILWHVGGDHPLSGDYRGRDAVFEYHAKARAQTADTLKLDPLDVLANDDHGGIFMRVTGERDGKTIDVVLAEALTFDEQGRWAEYWALADEQQTVDEFWR